MKHVVVPREQDRALAMQAEMAYSRVRYGRAGPLAREN
ncbi:hypothetical protein ABIG07_000266 [Bradyrhizobium ottawaense]|uniref:Uncharacterized protein n=1 Tax=Bradyrhizobium ottawaense TaxID=931866 RepID=A0ABV4FIC2_9BRAD